MYLNCRYPNNILQNMSRIKSSPRTWSGIRRIIAGFSAAGIRTGEKKGGPKHQAPPMASPSYQVGVFFRSAREMTLGSAGAFFGSGESAQCRAGD